MTENQDSTAVVRQRHEQMLKLVAKGFYNELINYGVSKAEVLTVASHLLDNNLHEKGATAKGNDHYNKLFRITDVQADWGEHKCLTVHQVSLRPLDPALIPTVAGWLKEPAVRESFVPPFPASVEDLGHYFRQPGREYFGIFYESAPVGIMGAEHIDQSSAKLEMRKLVGNVGLRGKGIGKRATFLFLYYAFEILQFQKIYLHSLDINIRNLNLNSHFGFELEGVFFEDIVVQGVKHDVVRMGLRAPVWRALFS